MRNWPKVFLVSFFLWSLTALNPVLVRAECSPPDDWLGVCILDVMCGPDTIMSGYCCDTEEECSPDVGGGVGTGGAVNKGPQIEACPTGGKGISTAIGCISFDNEESLATFFLTWGMGLGGGIALILIVIASFMVMTSAGDPKKLQAGKELLTSAVSGLIILVFAAYILNFVGVELLGIL